MGSKYTILGSIYTSFWKSMQKRCTFTCTSSPWHLPAYCPLSLLESIYKQVHLSCKQVHTLEEHFWEASVLFHVLIFLFFLPPGTLHSRVSVSPSRKGPTPSSPPSLTWRPWSSMIIGFCGGTETQEKDRGGLGTLHKGRPRPQRF